MSEVNSHHEEGRRLLSRWSDGLLADGERTRVRELLANDVAAREVYLNFMNLEANLEWELAGALPALESTAAPFRPDSAPALKPFADSPPPRNLIRLTAPMLALAASVIALLTVAGVWFWRGGPAVTVADASVGTLTEEFGAVWENPGASVKGAGVPGGWLRLIGGTVLLEMKSGARVVLEGPAEVELRSPMEVFLKSGKLTCRVAERAHGFRVEAPGLTVVDVGTAFGVQAAAERPAEVHVLEGKVEVGTQPGGPRRVLEAYAAVGVQAGWAMRSCRT